MEYCLFVVPNVFDLSQFGINVYNGNFLLITVLLLLVLPNVMRVFQPSLVGGNQLWSIGVEEQFYLVWPLLVRGFIKRILPFLFVFILIKLLITIGLEVWMSVNTVLLLEQFYRLWILLQVEQMAVGALGAYVLFHQKDKILKIIYHPVSHILSLALLALLFIVPVHHWWITYAEAVVFVTVIMNLSTNRAISFNMEGKLFNTLGNISYGIYMYHTLCITLCLSILRYFKLELFDQVLFNILLYTLSVITTIVVAYFSYELFEKRFLDLKERFMIIKSGKKATDAQQPGAIPVAVQPVTSAKEDRNRLEANSAV